MPQAKPVTRLGREDKKAETKDSRIRWELVAENVFGRRGR